MWRFLIITFFITTQLLALGQPQDTTVLKPKPFYGREAKVITYLLDHYHYRKLSLNDSLSEAILKQYIRELDNNRSYFLAADIASFNQYKDIIDDLTRQENVSIAYDIYSVFIKRYRERMEYVLTKLVYQSFDYTVDETYEADRENKPWAASVDELNEIWRKMIKSQALSLKLTGKKPDEITDILKKRYERFQKSFNQFNSEDVFSLYMNSITESYDPHTNYFSPKAADLFKQSMSLSLEGIGAQLTTENDYTKVTRILPGGDADKSGKLHANDYITGVAQGKDGEMVDVIGWRLDDVVKLIKGPKGTFVRLTVLPAATGIGGTSKEILLVRDKIKLEDQAAKKSLIRYHSNGKEIKLGVINLPSFYMDFDEYQKGNPDYRSTTRDVKKLINELKAEGISGLVMDLRNNGGGSLAEAIDLTGLFIKDGPVVQVKSSNNQIQMGEDNDQSIAYTGPLVVLTNRFSASASEIFAGAIQDYHRGVIVGESTYGKGTVQRMQDLSQILNEKNTPVGELKYTFQKFYRVSGSSTQHKGVEPDIKFPTALDPEQYGESSSPSAMPWDEIKQAVYQPSTDITSRMISDLNKSYRDRLKHDLNLKKYAVETEELRNNIRQKSVSLNEAIRKKQMEESEKKKTPETLDTKISANKEGLPQDELQKMKDEYLRESLLILSELAAKRIG
ncbi:MAG: tail-specific protease precursor [Cytophagales bacterium]|jgi:carboxyl-terminal processing protease|nr:carboxy terminal-processing peptidase [Bacteroidota bacterium]MBS1981733.1 carboxy terminal-processing peptidase [Bacteroidota bacterium]WHZ09124.1 MAG: tail-specific protease precursor [Cytophagales bacterium]